LWYGGLSSAARGREDEAVERFSRLLEQELPDNMRMVVQTQLAELGADIPTPAAGPPAEQGTAATGTILDVTVDIDAELASLVPPNAMLFLFARDAEQPGPPIAVKRLAAGQFPLQVRLSDSDAMVAGRKIESASRLVVVARISATGNPLESSGDLSGQAYPDPGEQLATQGIPVTITIDSATP